MGFSRERRDVEGERAPRRNKNMEEGTPTLPTPRYPGFQAYSPAALPTVAACHWSAGTKDLERDIESMKENKQGNRQMDNVYKHTVLQKDNIGTHGHTKRSSTSLSGKCTFTQWDIMFYP